MSYHHNTLKHLKKKYKHFAAAVLAGAAMMSVILPGIPAASAHAANPNAPDRPVAEKMVKPNRTAKKVNMKTAKREHTNAPDNYEKVLNITATAYAAGTRDNDQWGEKTYLGTDVRPGVIAVDPNLIPLGSQLYIQYPDGHGEYAVAEDTGGAIKGHRIDIAMGSDTQAEKFGIQDVKVFVVNSPDKA